jgi:hypothetical protein
MYEWIKENFATGAIMERMIFPIGTLSKRDTEDLNKQEV